MNYQQILKKLRSLYNPKNIAGMVRFGIVAKKVYGVSMPVLRKMAKQIGKDHELALKLWDSGIHECRIIATLIDDPVQVSEKQMHKWVNDFYSWDVCDQCCMNLFRKTRFAHKKILQWSKSKKPARHGYAKALAGGEFVKRAGFALAATLAVHDKNASDKIFLRILSVIKRSAKDERNMVKKAVNWALRQIGKRNINLNKAAIKTAKSIQEIDSRSAKWIAADALRELQNNKIIRRIKNKSRRKV